MGDHADDLEFWEMSRLTEHEYDNEPYPIEDNWELDPDDPEQNEFED